MKQVYKIDERGYYLEPVILVTSTDEEGNPFYDIPIDCVEVEPPSFYKAQWNGEGWVEAGEAPPPAPQTPSVDEQIDGLRNAILQLTLEGTLKGFSEGGA